MYVLRPRGRDLLALNLDSDITSCCLGHHPDYGGQVWVKAEVRNPPQLQNHSSLFPIFS